MVVVIQTATSAVVVATVVVVVVVCLRCIYPVLPRRARRRQRVSHGLAAVLGGFGGVFLRDSGESACCAASRKGKG